MEPITFDNESQNKVSLETNIFISDTIKVKKGGNMVQNTKHNLSTGFTKTPLMMIIDSNDFLLSVCQSDCHAPVVGIA